jgi:hypothetical protein
MPFPLAHPAAVLPLKRFCPRRLSFVALVIGAVCPDTSYLFSHYGWDDVAHSFKGGFEYCLPVGLSMLVAFLLLRGWLVQFLPERQRAVFLPLCRQPWGPPLALVVSLLIGIGTHLAWDSFTHKQGWMVEHVPILFQGVFRLSYMDMSYKPPLPSAHVIRVCHILGFFSTFAGCAVLAYEYQRWLSVADPSVGPISKTRAWLKALVAGCLVMPVDALHYLSPNHLVLALVGAGCLVLIGGFVWWVGRPAGARTKTAAMPA